MQATLNNSARVRSSGSRRFLTGRRSCEDQLRATPGSSGCLKSSVPLAWNCTSAMSIDIQARPLV
eukprot:14877571-Alexandrium_andersonii.AAC.1